MKIFYRLFRLLFVASIFIGLSSAEARAQSFEEYKKRARQNFEQYTRDTREKFENYRRKVNEDYAAFLEKAWRNVDSRPPLTRPKEEPPVIPPPAPIDIDTIPAPIYDDNEVIIDVVIEMPIDFDPQPEPVAPIDIEPDPQDIHHEFEIYGTSMKVRLSPEHAFRLNGADNKAVSQGWKTLSDPKYDALIADCLTLRNKHNLSDWHYLKMLKRMSESFLGDTNEATLLMAYVYSQSGYKMRLAFSSDKLYMCYASRHTIYGERYYQIDGIKYYTLDAPEGTIRMSDAVFPKETPLSLYLNTETLLAYQSSPERNLKSAKYQDMSFDVTTNLNLMALYNDYPTSEIGNNFMTRWAMYASAPISHDISDRLYPKIRSVIADKSDVDATQMILNWVQTAFDYEFDDKIWGGDRAFFADETLFYPYSDCEDRSILFSRLVRDLIGLEVILVYYPGHLATAVSFQSDDVKGDYLSLDGKRYVICDPTYENARIGMTMPNMDNSSANVILLPN